MGSRTNLLNEMVILVTENRVMSTSADRTLVVGASLIMITARGGSKAIVTQIIQIEENLSSGSTGDRTLTGLMLTSTTHGARASEWVLMR